MIDGESPHVLVVDDDWLVALDIADRVREMGYAVVGPAHSVAQALDLLSSAAIDAGLLDINLGAETSYPIARALKKRGIPYLFLTGYAAREVREEFRSVARISKPVEDRQLALALEAILA